MDDYWSMLPEKAKTNKKERFNIIMGVIKGEISLDSAESSTQTNPVTENSDDKGE